MPAITALLKALPALARTPSGAAAPAEPIAAQGPVELTDSATAETTSVYRPTG